MFPSLTEDVVFDPGEGDGALPAALAEAEQEGAGTLVAQQSLLPLFADEAHDGAAHGQKTLTNPAGTSNVQTSETNRKCRRAAHPSFQRDSRCLLITSRIPSIQSQKGNAFSLALCESTGNSA